MNEKMTNLDIRCAELGRELARISGIEEKIINAALAVLEEQGPYAMFLYLQARHEKVANDFCYKAFDFLKSIFDEKPGNTDKILDSIIKLSETENLDDLLFARDLLRNALSYARYHLKAREEEKN